MLFRRPGAPEAPRRLQKAPGGRKKQFVELRKMLFRRPDPRPGPPCVKKTFWRLKSFLCILQTGGAGGCEKQFSGFERSFLGVQGPRELETCFSASGGSGGMREAPKGSGGAQHQFSSCFFGAQGLQRRPGRSKRPRRARKQFGELRKMLFWCPESRPGPPRAKTNLLATEKFFVHFADWRPRRVRKTIFML